MKSFLVVVFVVFVVFSLMGCSSKSPVDANFKSNEISSELPEENQPVDSERSIIGVYSAEIDPVNQTFTVEPAIRESAYHFPLSNLHPGVLSIINYGWYTYFWANISLNHPFQGSGIDAFDPRVIVVLPALPGVSSEFPSMDILTNDSVIFRPDGYTKLWDDPSIPGNTNPFIAYFKNEPYRVWSSTGNVDETRRWEMNSDGFGGPMVFQLVVDVSTNYPNPPQPIVDNAPEPVDIFIDIEPGLGVDNTEKTITAAILSWHGVLGIGEVIASCPDLFDGNITLNFTGDGPAGSLYYSGVFQNAHLAPQGDYKMMVGARASNSSLFLYDETIIHVGGAPEFPEVVQDIGGFNSSTILHVDVDENYLCYCNGSILYIADVLSPEIARNVRSIRAQSYFIKAHNGYIYMADGAKVSIYDVDPVKFTHLVKVVDLLTGISCLDIEGHYLYGVGADTHIIDISDIESAYVVNTLDNPGNDVSVLNGYLYIANGDQLDILDVDPPETAALVQSITTLCPISGVHATGNLCSVSIKFSSPDPAYGLEVIDITTPETASIIGSYGSDTTWDQNIYVSGNYAYMPQFDHVDIIDIASPGTPNWFSSVTLEKCDDLCVKDNYAYVACREHEISIVKLW